MGKELPLVAKKYNSTIVSGKPETQEASKRREDTRDKIKATDHSEKEDKRECVVEGILYSCLDQHIFTVSNYSYNLKKLVQLDT